MEPLQIKEYPDAILRKKSGLVESVSDAEERLFEHMLFTMRHFAGIGLAAPQIGVGKRLIVADIGNGPVMLANPVILSSHGRSTKEEGCLSVPGVGVSISRPDAITVAGINEKNRSIRLRAHGLLARVLQHEIDHLYGKLIIDYAGSFETMFIYRQTTGQTKKPYADL